MTTIVYRNGTIAADTGCTQGDNQFCFMSKIARNGVGDLVGVSGDAGKAQSFIDWFIGGEQGDHPVLRDIASDRIYDKAAIFRAAGIWEIYEPPGRFMVRGPYYAMGSGKPEALGALFVGASAYRAVEAAVANDQGSFGPIETLTHK